MLEWLRVVWLTPAMDGAVPRDRRPTAAGSSTGWCWRSIPAMASGRLDYEKAMRGRNRLLTEGSRDSGWFDAIETQMAETGVAIAAARANWCGCSPP